MAKKSNGLILLVIIIVSAAAGAFVYKIANMPDRRTTEEKVNDAMKELQKGFDNAAEQLKDRNPLDDMEDASKEMVEDIKKATEKVNKDKPKE